MPASMLGFLVLLLKPTHISAAYLKNTDRTVIRITVCTGRDQPSIVYSYLAGISYRILSSVTRHKTAPFLQRCL